MILNNRKDTYDNTTRGNSTGLRPEAGGGEQSTGREDLSSGSGEQVERCGAHGAEDSQQADAGHDREARHQDPGPGNSGGRASRIYPGIQARAEAAGDANQLRRRRRRITNRGLRAPSSGYRIKLQATSKPQARTKLQAASAKLQATSHKQQAPGSRPLDKVSGYVDRGSLLYGRQFGVVRRIIF
jgi:hypothetical protein